MKKAKKNDITTIDELLPCPFCGSKAIVRHEGLGYVFVGCSEISMLCPNPQLVVYQDKDGNFDYKWWNRRST